MRTAAAAALISITISLAAAGCGGDDHSTPPDGASPPDAPPSTCAPTPAALPPGPLADPRLLGLPATCVVGGLRDIPGRWFVRNPDSQFSFQYPRYEGDCTTGFRRANVGPDDDDLSDGQIFTNWSDGTIVSSRTYYQFDDGSGGTFEYVTGLASCVLPDGSLASMRIYYDTDQGEVLTPWQGKRFAPLDAPALGIDKVGELGTGLGGDVIAYNVVVEGHYAYTVGPLGLDIIDVADPAAPVAVGHVDGTSASGGFNDVRVVANAGKVVAYCAPLYNDNTHVIDVTDPTAPVEQASVPQYSHSVFIRQNGAQILMYLATYTDNVPVYDVTAPLVPVLIGSATVPPPYGDGVHDLFATADTIYANSTTAGMVAIDVSAGLANGVEAGRIQTSYSHAAQAGIAGGRAVVLNGDEGMNLNQDGGAFLRILEGDPASPGFISTEIGRYQTRPEVGIHNIQLVGNKVYIAYYHDGARIIDISEPTSPVEIAHYNTWDDATAPGGPFEAALGIRLVNGLIYVADSLRGLIILRETP